MGLILDPIELPCRLPESTRVARPLESRRKASSSVPFSPSIDTDAKTLVLNMVSVYSRLITKAGRAKGLLRIVKSFRGNIEFVRRHDIMQLNQSSNHAQPLRIIQRFKW